MNRNLVIVLAGGLLIAVVVAMMVQASLGSGKKKAVVAEAGPKVQILVASKALTTGDELDETNMKWQEWPEGAVFAGAIQKKDDDDTPIEEILSGRLRRPVSAGEPLMENVLVKEESGSFVAASLSPGMRAMAIDVKNAALAGGLIKAGDYVDVVLTYKRKIVYKGDDDDPRVSDMMTLNLDKFATETVLQNVRVLAVDKNYKVTDEEGAAPKAKSSKSRTVTLEVDRRGAEVLALSKEMGKISLALRKLGDAKIDTTPYKVITDERLTHITDEIYDEMLRIQKSSGQTGNIVRIYNGYMQQKVPVGP